MANEQSQDRLLDAVTDRQMPEVLTVKDVAGILKVPASWVYEHTRPGCSDPIPSFKVGKYLRFLPDQIRAYLLRQCEKRRITG